MSLLDETDEIMMWDGGNPLHPQPPFNYILTFNIAGLTNEYYGVANFIREGKVVEVPTFKDEDYEIVEFPAPIGRMEAFVAGGGTSTMPWTFEGKLKTLWNRRCLARPLRRMAGVYESRFAGSRLIDVDGTRFRHDVLPRSSVRLQANPAA
jgi:lysine 6-dehydrogenase